VRNVNIRKPLPCSLATLALGLLVALAGSSSAQSNGTEDDAGAWFMLMADGRFERPPGEPAPWRWWFDAQGRFLDDSNGYDQGLLRPALGYDLSERSSLWLGYAFVHSDPVGRASSEEHRIFEQFLWARHFDTVGFQSRTRLEQRFDERGSETGWRFREFVKATYPFASRPNLGLAGYEEVFFDLNSTDWGQDSGFSQNRLFAGLFWKSGPTITFELGYLNQLIDNDDSADRMNHILSLNLFLKFP
jgi:hypothetical protein